MKDKDAKADQTAKDFWLATNHWTYTEKILTAMVEVCGLLYVEAFIHGMKHGRDEVKKTE